MGKEEEEGEGADLVAGVEKVSGPAVPAIYRQEVALIHSKPKRFKGIKKQKNV